MADGTGIEWCDATWQPITGCAVVSPGCTNCYAMRLAGTRLKEHPSRAGLTRDTRAGPVWTGEVRFNEDWLDQPLRWKKPRRIFVCAHGDLFAEAVPDAWIDRVFAVMALAPQHTFIVLTKRAVRMRAYMRRFTPMEPRGVFPGRPGPLPNIWLGISIEDQVRADERVPALLETPAAVRFISAEPLLSALDLRRWLGGPRIQWIICGGESGPGARPMLRAWARDLRDQCKAARVAYFHKQNGEFIDADEWFDGLTGKITIDGEPWRPARPLNYTDAERLAQVCGRTDVERQSDGTTLIRVGKKAAGRLLDGLEHNKMPDDV